MTFLTRCSLTVSTLVFLGSVAFGQLTGGNTYPINGTENPPTSFATMKSAAAYLNANGVTGAGNVILEFSTGYPGETDTVGIRAISGAGSGTRIVFRPATGFTALSSIAGLASPNQHTIRIAGASYITLDGRAGGVGNSRDWTVQCTGTNGQMAVRLDNTSGSMTGIIIRNLIMEAEAANTTGGIFQITGNTTNTMTDVVIEENLIRSNPGASTFRGFAITVATASNAGNTGLIIRNNEITQFYAHGINFTGGFPGAMIYGNSIHHTSSITQPSTTNYRGIQFSTSSSAGTEIFNNFIYDVQLANGPTTHISGIEVLTGNTSGNPVKIYNNRIVMGPGITATSFAIYGIHQNSTATTHLIDVYYNSVYIGGTSTAGALNSAAFRKAGSSNMNVRDNIFYNARSNDGGTGTHWGIMSNNSTYLSISNNDYYADGTGGVLGTNDGATTGNRGTISEWLAAVPTDVASISQNPQYVNPSATPPNVKINTAIPSPVDSTATPIAGITSDFEGDPRNTTTPDIGADEFVYTPLDHDLRMLVVLLPASQVRSGDTVQFRAVVENLSPTSTEASYTVNWFVDATPQTAVVAGPISPGATDTVALPWTAVFEQHLITAIASIPADADPTNDTARVNVGVYGQLFATSADSLTGSVFTGGKDSVMFYVRNQKAISADFSTRAVRYLTPGSPDSVVAPNAYANTSGGSTFLGPLANTPRTHLQLIHEDELTSVLGKFLSGITWRLGPSAGTSWPPTDATVTNYDVYLGPSVAPSAVSNTVAENYVGPRTKVRSGSLTIPAGSLPSGGNPNAFGMTIEFDTPWQYTGGHLAIELRQSGLNTSTSVDAAGTATPGYGTLYVTRWASGDTVSVASSQGNFAVTKLALSSGGWLTVNPTSGTIAPGDSVLMKGGFDASNPGITAGTYYGHVEMTATNTTLADTLRVPTRLSVQLSPNPQLWVSLDSLNFGTISVGASKMLSVLVRNTGGPTLTVSNITMPDPSFSANPTSFSLAYNDTQRVQVTFTGLLPGDSTYNGMMTFVSNSVPAGQTVNLVGSTFGLPLSGDYTVGLTLFNRVTGRNLTVERRHRTVKREVDVEIEIDAQTPSYNEEMKEDEHRGVKTGSDVETDGLARCDVPIREPERSIVIERRFITEEEEYGVLMENGKPYERMGDDPQGIFPTITDAVADLVARGVSGPVRFLLVDATYASETYPITLPAVTGMNVTNTVTIKPAIGVNTIIGGSATNLFVLTAAGNFIFDGSNTTAGTTRNMTIRNTSTTGVLIRAQDGSASNVVKNCIMEGAVTSTTSGLVFLSTSASGVEGNSGNTFTNNLFTNASGATYSNAVYSSGTTTSPNTSMLVTGNEFVNFTGTGVRGTTGTGGGWTVTGNHFYNNAGTPPTTTQAGININPGVISGSNTFSGNFIGGSAPNAGGSPWTNTGNVNVSGIIAGVDTVNPSLIQNNVIQNFSCTGTGASSFNGISMTTGRATISGNTISNVTVAGTSTTHGIQVTATSVSQPTTVANNLIANLSATGTGTGVRVRGIHFTGGAQFSILDNTIHGLSTNGTQTGLTANNQVAVGINLWPGGVFYLGEVSGNTIYDIAANNTGALGSVATGMMLTNDQGIISRNRIYDIRNLSTGTSLTLPPIASGVYMRFLDEAAFFNNMISVGSDQTTNTQFNGVFNVAGAVSNDIAFVYNSINVSGTATAGDIPCFAFMRGDNTGLTPNTTLTLRNNVLSNTRSGGTGKHYAIANQSTVVNDTGWSPTASDYNALHTSNSSTVGLWGSVDQTFAGWQTASGGDANSVSADPLFVSSTDLHITNPSSPASDAGTAVAGITTDFDGETRNATTPDIGMDEFAGGSSTVTLGVQVAQNWNIVSLPVSAPTPDDSVKHIFVNSLNPYAFAFVGGYVQRFTMSNGPGYWIKSSIAYTQDITGTQRDTLTVPVAVLWNMIGSISTSIDTSAAHVTPTPANLRASNYFKYSNGYVVSTTIEPGFGYWVKANAPGGTFFMHVTGPAAKVSGEETAALTGRSIEDLNMLTIQDANGGSQTLYFGTDGNNEIPVAMFAMPPAPPEGSFDARFASSEGGLMVQTHAEQIEDVIDLPITVQSSAYPLTVSWKVNGTTSSYELSDGSTTHPVRGEGTLRITNSRVQQLMLKVTGSSGLPKEFALSQNYPNPFNPTTNIKYALPVDSKVTAEIYNVLGQRVRTLLNDTRPAGYHVAEWDGKNNAGQQLSSGLYFLQLSAKGTNGKSFSEVRKLMMLK